MLQQLSLLEKRNTLVSLQASEISDEIETGICYFCYIPQVKSQWRSP